MSARMNACSELTRFWLELRHGYLTTESVAVPVPYATSDIDVVAVHPKNDSFPLPDGTPIGPRLIVEAKDEHDWEPSGREFAGFLKADLAQMGEGKFIARGARNVKFTMLREQHYERAVELFGNEDFDRLIVVHALDPTIRAELEPHLVPRRIYLLTIRELVQDLASWYRVHPRPAVLRNTLLGDVLHLLLGFCRLQLPPSA